MRWNMSLHLSNRQLANILILFLLGSVFGIIINSSIYLLGGFLILLIMFPFMFFFITWSITDFEHYKQIKRRQNDDSVHTAKIIKTFIYAISIMLTIDVFCDLLLGILGTNTVNALNSVINSMLTGK